MSASTIRKFEGLVQEIHYNLSRHSLNQVLLLEKSHEQINDIFNNIIASLVAQGLVMSALQVGTTVFDLAKNSNRQPPFFLVYCPAMKELAGALFQAHLKSEEGKKMTIDGNSDRLQQIASTINQIMQQLNNVSTNLSSLKQQASQNG